MSETYTFGTVHDRAVDLDFDGWNNKYYYGSPTNNYKGTSFGGSAFKDDAGVKAGGCCICRVCRRTR